MAPGQKHLVVAGAYNSVPVEASIIRNVKRRSTAFSDRNFLVIALFSCSLHIAFIFYFRNKEVAPPPPVSIEKIPERFARLIIEKPIPKADIPEKTIEQSSDESIKPVDKASDKSDRVGDAVDSRQRTRVQRSVDARVARVEQKIRTVGVLGMLTGVGGTTKGPAVVDVLGAIKDRRSESVDLEAELDRMTGLQKAGQIDVLDRKLVKSKDIAVSYREDIDDLIAGVGGAQTVDLAKKGSFIIQKPQSIEGAASTNAKRDNDAINAVVSSHKASIRMSYEKYLKRDPTLAGKITIRFTIAASGSVSFITAVDNTTGNLELEEEIIRKIRMWHFEEIPEGEVTVTYPFVFAPAG